MITTLIHNKRVLLALAMIVFVAAAAIAATGAFFSDTETSTGNTFTAGAIDLKIDSQQHYNGNDCVDGEWVGNAPYPVAGSNCTGTWNIRDLTVEKFFDFNDVKPGDYGENTISIHVDTNDAYMCAALVNTGEADNTKTEPEALDDLDGSAVGEATGELDNVLNFFAWVDEGSEPGFQGNDSQEGDNIYQQGERVLGTATASDLHDQTWALAEGGDDPIVAGSTGYIGLSWCVGTFDDQGNCDGSQVDNASQTDSWFTDLAFYAVQSRNNSSFSCQDWRPSNGGDQGPKVGANLSAYETPSCNATVSGSASVQSAIDEASADQTICVDDSYDGTGDNSPIRVNKDGLKLAALTQGVGLDVPVVLDNDNTTVTGFAGTSAAVLGEVAAFYINNDVDGAEISYNTVDGTGAPAQSNGVLVSSANVTTGHITNNRFENLVRGMYINPSRNMIAEYNDFDNNTVGVANSGPGTNIIRYSDFSGNSEAIGKDDSIYGVGNGSNDLVLSVTFNNIPDGEVNNYGAVAMDAANNFWNGGGSIDQVDQAGGATGLVNTAPEAGSAYVHN